MTIGGVGSTISGLLKSGGVWFLLLVLTAAGCSKPKEEEKPVFMIKTPILSVSRFDFVEELDLKRAAYPYNIDENPGDYNEMVIHLVEILSEEIVLLSAAAEKGVMVTDQELETAEAEFKKDYPGNSFERMLLENAISYTLWKKKFKKDMIMEKLVNQELRDKIEITSQDIIDFYKELQLESNEQAGEVSNEESAAGREEELVSRLRMQKTQDMYDEWIQSFWQAYPVEINKEELKAFLIALDNSEGSEDETKK